MRLNEFDQPSMTCSKCGGPAFGDLLLAEKKDACYNKVRSRYKVWPSAYASGALVQCRKKGAANWGNKSKNENLNEFARGGDGGDDGPGDDPYKYPKPEHYSRAIDFYSQFEADHFDKEDFNDATGEFRGYWNEDGKLIQIAYFKFDNPRRTGDNHPGMGWYYEPEP
jgi:hypothetical protein